MAQTINVFKLWDFAHCRVVESLAMAGDSNEVLLADRRDSLVLIGADGALINGDPVEFSPVAADISADGQGIFALTFNGYVVRLDRNGAILWKTWLDRDAQTIAAKTNGKAVVMASHKGRFHVVKASGEKVREVHTAGPVAFAKYSGDGRTLFMASSMGWIGVYDKMANPVGEYDISNLVMDLDVNFSGSKIFTAAGEAGLNIIDVKDGHLVSMDPGFGVVKLGVNAPGNLIAAAGLNGELALISKEGDVLWSEKTPHPWALCRMNSKGDRFVAVSNKGLAICYSTGENKAQAEEPSPPPPPQEPKPKPEPKTQSSGGNRDNGEAKSDFDFIEI